MTQDIPPKHLVLYADDDEDDLFLVKEAFYNYATNVEVKTFKDGISLLNYLQYLSPGEAIPCLIILDINMPILNGKDTLAEIRNFHRFADIPVVIFTTSSYPFDRTFAENLKAGFITKPLNTEQLARIAEQFIEYCSDDIRNNIQKKML